ncbi:translation initiation factor 2 [Actinoplanes sp. NPDC051859]|uniref:translation initiation factor 2 n=1 Tax=Actinoplanes sp. NPDC051859 TaxID=3363909 RepID=UPI0037875FE9
MLDQHPHPPTGADRILWRGHCAVAEYAFDRAASLPRWTLPEATEVVVTGTRIGYAYAGDDAELRSGELRWLYPQHIRVQPGSRNPGRAAAVTQIQLVCGGADGSFPALVFAGGDLTDIRAADRMANIIRHAIAGFRVDNADKLGLNTSQARMLSKLLIGPEFTNFQGGEGQTVTMLGALQVPAPPTSEPHDAPATPPPTAGTRAHAEPTATPHAGYPTAPLSHGPHPATHATHPTSPIPGGPYPATHATHPTSPTQVGPPPTSPALRPAAPAEAAGSQFGAHADRGDAPAAEQAARPFPAAVGGSGRLPGYRPGLAADEARALQAAAAEQATHDSEPDLASRAARLAARVANLVANLPDDDVTPGFSAQPALEQQPTAEHPTADLAARAEQVRRTAARFAGNSAKGKAQVQRSEHETGLRGQG